MFKDLHIHIERGPYDKTWIERFVQQAIKMNIDEINLVEHSIRIKEFHPTFKEAIEYNLYQAKWFNGKENQAHTFEEYKSLVNEIRKIEYPIKINFGLEVCWFEQHENYIRQLLSDNYFDYVLGSVHWIDNWTFNQRKYQWLGKDIDSIYKRYYALNESLIESDIFDIVAHPDLITCHNLYPSYNLSETYMNICKKAKEHNIMLEMNTSKGLGLNEQFLKIALNSGVSLSTGSDAHRPEDVGRLIKDLSKKIAPIK